MSETPSDSPPYSGSSTANAVGDPDALPSSPASPTPPIFVQTSSVGDSAAAIDELGFELYVNALADFLVAPNTRAPLTCSIEGSWGSGKSSFMLQLRNRLKTVSPHSRSVEFNAWKYDKQEELWAAFALNLTRSLRSQTHWTRRFLGDCRLYFSRIKSFAEAFKLATFALAWLTILAGACFIFVNFARQTADGRAAAVKQAIQDLSHPEPASGAKTSEAAAANKAAPTPAPPVTVTAPAEPTPAQKAQLHDVHYWLGESTWAGAAIVILALFWKLPDSFRKRLFSTQIEQYIDRPDYKGKAAFLDTFTQDFARTVRAHSRTPGGKIFVFIDDLDRCEAPKAADLMQAINLLIGDGNPLIFILGLDRAKVAAAIAFKFREIIPFLEDSPRHSTEAVADPACFRNFGDGFLEKFIQLSFRLPVSSNESQARIFIDSLITDSLITASPSPDAPQQAAAAAERAHHNALRIESGTESQRIKDILMMVREVLGYSPRRIKSFLNSFRLALYIASAQGLLDVDKNTGDSEVTPETLGKFLALTSRFPELRGVLDRDPGFLGKLENIALAWMGETSDPLDVWLERPGVRKLLSYGMVEKDLTRAWQKQFSMKDFPAWKFDTVLPSIPPPIEPRQTASAAGPNPQSTSTASVSTSETRTRLNRAAAAARVESEGSFSSLFSPSSRSGPEPAAAGAATPQSLYVPDTSNIGIGSKQFYVDAPPAAQAPIAFEEAQAASRPESTQRRAPVKNKPTSNSKSSPPSSSLRK